MQTSRLYRFVRDIETVLRDQLLDVERTDFYVGITNDIRRRLFDEHKLDEERDRYIHQFYETVDEARQVEAFFLNDMRLDGGSGGGEEDSHYVYIYLKSDSSDP